MAGAVLIYLFLALIETGLLLFCCGVGKKYRSKVFASGVGILIVWILGVAFQATWLFEWINIYLMLLIGVLLTVAGMVSILVKS